MNKSEYKSENQQKYFICFEGKSENGSMSEFTQGEVYKRKFDSLAKALDFRTQKRLDEYAIQRIPNACTFTNVSPADEQSIKDLKIPFIKPPYKAPPLRDNIEFGRCNSIIVPIQYENTVSSKLPNCPIWNRYFELKFGSAEPLTIPIERSSKGRGVDSKFLKACYETVKEAGFDERVVPAALQEALSELSVIELEGNPESKEAHGLEGISLTVRDVESVVRIRKRLPEGYTAYTYDIYFPKHVQDAAKLPPGTLSLSKVIIIRSISDDEFLKCLGTDAFNYNISNLQMREIVKHWNQKYNAILLGASEKDSIDLLFPQILDEGKRKKLVAQMVEFCPEILNMDSRGKKVMEARLSSSGIVNLWWD